LRNLARLIHRLLFIPHAVPPRADTAPDLNPGASSVKMTVPSHGEMLLGIFYEAAGPGKHPTVVLPHGFPGYEQNLDLAQAMRRAGWNVLAMHYRGSWGVGGDFSLAHASEDADAMVAFAHSPEPARKYHIDPDRIVVVGHSMGGVHGGLGGGARVRESLAEQEIDFWANLPPTGRYCSVTDGWATIHSEPRNRPQTARMTQPFTSTEAR